MEQQPKQPSHCLFKVPGSQKHQEMVTSVLVTQPIWGGSLQTETPRGWSRWVTRENDEALEQHRALIYLWAAVLLEGSRGWESPV